MVGARTLGVVLVGLALVLAGCAGGAPAGSPSVESPSSPTDTDSSTTTVDSAETPNGTVSVHYINVGQSVSTLVVGPTGETMLVDTGHFNDDGEHVLAYLRRHNVTRIDHLVVSHNDADHIGGNAAVIDYFEREADGIGAVYDPGIAASTLTYESYLDAVEANNVTLYETREGDPIRFEGVDVQVLGPPEPYVENEARNENSIVLRLGFGTTSFLLPGDAEDDQEAYLVEQHCDDLESTVLKAGHHGSASSSTGLFLDAVDPEAVVVSSAYDSQYRHPDEAVLRRLANRSIPTYWTATQGDVVLVSDGRNVSVRTQQDAPTDPLAVREGTPVEPGNDSAVVGRTRIETGADATPERRATVTDGGTTAVATDGGTATVTDGGTDAPDDGLAVVAINADAEGDDRENLNDEYVAFENTGEESLNLTDWTVSDEAGKEYEFPEGFTLDPGETVTLHTGSGTDTATDLYWGSGSPVWNNAGDTVIVHNSQGERVRNRTYD